MDQVFEVTSHPYTKSLLTAIPSTDIKQRRDRIVLRVDVPSPANSPSGCGFLTRCPLLEDICKEVPPFVEVGEGHFSRCSLIEKYKREMEIEVSANS